MAKKERLEQSLVALGDMAKIHSPTPRRNILLPSPVPKGFQGLSKHWRLCFGTALAAALAVVVVFWSGFEDPGREDTTNMLALETWEGEGFMTEINTLVENALPTIYLDISGEGETRLDDDFMQFILPPAENGSVSYETGKEGVKLC